MKERDAGWFGGIKFDLAHLDQIVCGTARLELLVDQVNELSIRDFVKLGSGHGQFSADDR